MGCLPLKWQRPRRGRLSCAGARFLFIFGVYTPCGRRISGVFGAFAGGPAPLVAERLPDADAAFRHGVADRSGVDGFIRVHLVRVFLRKALELALALQGIALFLEILPIGSVMVFATSPTERTIEVYSYFSMLPVGYANFTPLLTGILTILIILLGVIALFKFDKATSIRKVMFVCSVVSLMLSIVPLFLFGTVGMTAASYVISCVILLSLCLQAVANRQE